MRTQPEESKDEHEGASPTGRIWLQWLDSENYDLEHVRGLMAEARTTPEFRHWQCNAECYKRRVAAA